MRTPLAWRNLIHRKIRAVVSILGLSFPIVMVFVQLGIYEALMKSATLLYDHLHFDLALVSSDYFFFSKPGSFPRRRLEQALAVEGVESAKPLYIGYQLWRNPQTRFQREILLMGIDPRDPPRIRFELMGDLKALRKPDTVLIDLFSRPEYGPREPGLVTEIGARQVEVIGQYRLGSGFAALGAAMTGDLTWSNLLGASGPNRVNVGLITLAPGEESGSAAGRLQQWLPADVRVWTREELSSNERAYWTQVTSVGVVLGFGLIVTCVVGIIILYQILYTDIVNRLHEYATLQAIGYRPGYVSRVVWEQTLILCGAGFVPAVGFSLFLYDATVKATSLPMSMTWARVFLVFFFTGLIGWVAGSLSLRKAKSADPADLFK